MLISLMGYMGSGKSTIGKELAKTFNYKFIDLDEFIEASENQSISEIFKNGGEIKFRKLERLYLLEILEEEKNAVIALGGETAVYYDNINKINEHSSSFYIRMTPHQLFVRLVKEIDSSTMI